MPRQNGYNRGQRAQRDLSYRDTFTDGNTVRKVQAVPSQKTRKQQRPEERAVINTARHREQALRVNKSFVYFMIVICTAMILVSVNYLKLQAEGTSYRTTIANMEGELSDLKLTNDYTYEQTMASIDMEAVKKIAINELGMRYAKEGQIITYNSQHGDYIRQYGEITPEE